MHVVLSDPLIYKSDVPGAPHNYLEAGIMARGLTGPEDVSAFVSYAYS